MQAVWKDKHLGLYCCSCRAQVSLLNPQMAPLCWSYLTWCNWHWLACLGHEGPEVEAGCTCWEQGQGLSRGTVYESPLCKLGVCAAGCMVVLSQGCMHLVQVCAGDVLVTREQSNISDAVKSVTWHFLKLQLFLYLFMMVVNIETCI